MNASSPVSKRGTTARFHGSPSQVTDSNGFSESAASDRNPCLGAKKVEKVGVELELNAIDSKESGKSNGDQQIVIFSAKVASPSGKHFREKLDVGPQ